MNLVFLGTGTSQGVPPIASDFEGIDLSNSKNWRTRSSVHVEMDGLHIQVDAAPEFRLQCLNNGIKWIDLFILTHGHADHVCGMDDLRRFCDLRDDNAISVYSNPYGLERVRAIYPYALGEKPAERGYPCFRLNEMPDSLALGKGRKIHSCALPHGPVETLGLVFESKKKKLAYFTDCKALTPRAKELAAGADVLVIDALKLKPHASHMTIFEAIDAAKELGAKRTFLTHTTWHIDYGEWEKKLPENIHVAYDNLRVEV